MPMNVYEPRKRTKYRLLMLLLPMAMAFMLALALFAGNKTASAQISNTACLDAVYPGGGTVCTAEDVTIAEMYVVDLIDPCDYPGDMAIVVLQAEVIGGAKERYDIGLWVNTEGGSAQTETTDTTACYRDHLYPITDTIADLNLTGGFGPFYNAEASEDPGDTCGDSQQGITNFRQLQQLTIVCQDNTLPPDGTAEIGTCVSWDNAKSDGSANKPSCTNTAQTLPNTKSKCNCEDNTKISGISVPPVRLAIDKAGPAKAGPGETYSYAISYTNVVIPGGIVATNVTISDELHADLKPVAITGLQGAQVLPASPSYPCFVDDPTQISPIPPNAIPTDAYGAKIYCKVPDLAQGASGTLTITVMVDPAATNVQDIPNTACVGGVGSSGTAPPAEVCDTITTTTPVSLSFFEVSLKDDGTLFEWATGSETGNAGFNIYVDTAEGRQKVNDSLILSTVVDSLDQNEYSFEAAGLQGESFYIEDVSLFGENRLQGPFAAGEAHGQLVQQEAIDWAAIQLENEALSAERTAAARAALAPVENAAQPANIVQRVLTWAGNLLNVALGGSAASAAAETTAYPAVDLRVNADGIYRVTYEDLLANTGANLAGVNAADLALSTADGNVPIYVGGGRTFGPGSYIEFYGQGLDTLYTDSNVYKLEVDGAAAWKMAVDSTRTGRKDRPAAYYMETVAVENNSRYSYLASNGDPWYDALLFTTSNLAFTRDLVVDNYVDGAPSVLSAEMWGMSELLAGPDHHVQMSLNGQLVADSYFDAQNVEQVSEQLPAGSVKEGVNKLTFTVPNDQGAEYDMSALEMYSLTYPRAFVARDGQLAFSGAADAFRVTDLDSQEIVAYRVVGNTPTRLSRIKIGSSGGSYSATFAGSQGEASYYVSTEAAVAVPEMALSRAAADITSGSAELLIISHPNFIGGLAPLVSARQAQGYTVKVVDVEDIYAQFSGGVFDAQAIKAYISYAIKNMDVEYVLLAGGDSRDYRDYSGVGSISFIPSLYAKTIQYLNFAPVDPLYADVWGDNVPDAAIGRFPVRTVDQLTTMVNKTLAYDARTERDTAVFAADVSYEADSDSFAPAGWSVEKAYVGPDGLATAKTNLINGMNAGPALASFVGHSNADRWTFDPLFHNTDAAALSNDASKPMVVTQWGCWNTYYVGGEYESLGDNFLLRGSNGAAAVTGATTITDAASERALGKLLMPKLVLPGVSIGKAMQSAKAELARENGNSKMVDVLLGWTILGDPTLVVQP